MSDRRSAWRAVALVLVLAGLPSASVRGLVLAQDSHLGPLDGRPAIVLETRKTLARLQEHDADQAAAAGAEPGQDADAMGLLPARAHVVLDSGPASLAAAARPRLASLLPDCTGPPRA